jgi:dynein heavy chain 2
LNQVQRKWVYLEPIFGRGALPKEQSRFKGVDRDFRDIMIDIVKDTRVIALIAAKDISSKLKNMVDQLQRCQKALNEFLEEKRSIFPRFYFIGDDDLLEILGQATNPIVIQTHLKKLFAGIHQVKFDDKNEYIVAMRSLEGEVVPLLNKVKLSHQVENWLDDLSKEMVNTLQKLLVQVLQESRGEIGNYNVDRYPSQVLCLAESIAFTERCERAIKAGELSQLHRSLKSVLEKYTSVDYGKSSNSTLLELKYKALIMDVIHYVDVVEQLIHENCRSASDWPWQRQLRFYMSNKREIAIIRMVDAEFLYTYEYQGNAQKLVHTPLTDKCYLTLTQGMYMGFGGNPYGPAGTGKTESVKALGGLFGRQVLVFNCDEGIDVKSIGRIFVGICKCGAWGCFDEFNRLDEAVLSAVSMQIQVIQDSLRSRSGKVFLLEKEVIFFIIEYLKNIYYIIL